jgi:S1-C subfamily serine protease
MALLFAANDLRGRKRPLLPIIESPGVGDEIVLVGYPEMANDIQTNPQDPTQVVADLKMLEGRGRITTPHPNGRDKTLAYYPCFETSASMASGQSGGPALDFNKVAVIGINSRSFGEDVDYSIISWFGKTLDVPFGFDDVEFRTASGNVFPVRNTTLRRLAEAGIVQIV